MNQHVRDNIIILPQPAPAKPTGRITYIITIEGRRTIASNHWGDCGLDSFNLYGWVARKLSAEFDCDIDEVGCVESEEGDVWTVRGEPVAFLSE